MLSGKYRFHGYGSLNYLFRRGQTVRGRYLLLRYTTNTHRPESRIAVIVSKKVSKSAVIRNRIRRRVFEAVRVYHPGFQRSYDLAFIILSEEVAVISTEAVKRDIELLLKRADILAK